MRRARRKVCAALHPFVDRSLVAASCEGNLWQAPYPMGFLVVAITHVALRSGPELNSDTLARLQADCWRLLTGLSHLDIGERVAFFSLEPDPDFLAGCRDAADWIRQSDWIGFPPNAEMAMQGGFIAIPSALWDGWEATIVRRMECLAGAFAEPARA